MLACMNDLRKKNVRYAWTDQHEEQFQRLKKALMEDPIQCTKDTPMLVEMHQVSVLLL